MQMHSCLLNEKKRKEKKKNKARGSDVAAKFTNTSNDSEVFKENHRLNRQSTGMKTDQKNKQQKRIKTKTAQVKETWLREDSEPRDWSILCTCSLVPKRKKKTKQGRALLNKAAGQSLFASFFFLFVFSVRI